MSWCGHCGKHVNECACPPALADRHVDDDPRGSE